MPDLKDLTVYMVITLHDGSTVNVYVTDAEYMQLHEGAPVDEIEVVDYGPM